MFGTAEKLAPVAAHALAPARWLALDVETGDAPEPAIAAALEAWQPPGNVKDPAKIEARRTEAMEKIRERAALLDASPILCIAAQTDRVRIVWNGMDGEAYGIDGWQCVPCGGERGMLLAFREWADTAADSATVLVGHNHRGFDLPKLRSAYVRHRLRLPTILVPKPGDAEKNETVDTMSLFKAFSMEYRDERYIGLDTVAAGLGIPRPKQVITGADIPRLHREGEHQAILIYCAVDATTTARAYQLMTSSAADLE